MTADLKPAVIYARYSSHSQTEQSIEGQLHDAYAFAEKNGYTVLHEYIDRALTGTSDSRPAFQQMIKDAEKHSFRFVIVWKLDRFARNRYDSAVYKRTLKKHGVRVISVKENITDSPEGVILEGLLESMAEYYSANLSENIKRGKAESVRKGLFPGGPVAYGYTVQDLRLVPDPRTAPVVKEIFERYAAGERNKDIFTDLNSRGLRARRGALFQYSTLQHILDNRLYVGDFYYGDQLVEGCVTPIIDRDLFDRCASRRAMNHRNPAASRTPESRSLLLEKIFCGECGGRMIGGRGVSASGVYFYYQCRGRSVDHNGCRMPGIQKRDIEYAVCRIVSDFLLNKKRKTLEAIADSVMEIIRSDFDASELQALEAQREQTDRDLNKLIDSLISMPESTRPRIAARMELLERQLKDLDVQITRKRAESCSRFSRDDFVDFLQVTLQDLEKESNIEFIINSFINSVYLYADGRIVVYLNHLRGLPDTPPDSPPPGTDSYKEGRQLFGGGSVPPELSSLKGFSSCSSLYTYSPTCIDKDEQHAPLLFFLHGHIGIIAWRHVIPNELIRDRGKIIKNVKRI